MRLSDRQLGGEVRAGFNTAPCSPELLNQQGYRTVASHPNAPGFWNRINAYQRIGFETFWSKSDFDLDEMIVWMLSDRSLYRQGGGEDRFGAGKAPRARLHRDTLWPLTYDMVPERPAVVPVDPNRTELGQYATAMHYKSIEQMDEIERLRRDDPTSLIIASAITCPISAIIGARYKNNGFFAGGWERFPGGHVCALARDTASRH